VANIYMGTIT